MSLVAYGNSSGSESEDSDNEEQETKVGNNTNPRKSPEIEANEESLSFALPTPSTSTGVTLTEEDDEFLRKKAVPEEKPPPPPTQKAKGPVKIAIPSLKDFQDLDEDKSTKKATAMLPANKPSGLLNFLPKPKAEQLFQPTKPEENRPGEIPKTTTTTRSFVPHSLTKKTQIKPTVATAGKSKQPPVEGKTTKSLISYADSDEEEDADGASGSVDFFSLTAEKDELPKVSKNEVNLMVAKRAAQMAESTAKFDAMVRKQEEERLQMEEAARLQEENYLAQQERSRNPSGVDPEALQSLIGGSRAKRARLEDLDFVELSHEQVMPSRDEWVRQAVAGSTQAQVRGQLKDGPKGMAKKKHQITYLAHQAKSNEAELQAIWAANRSTQRQSQSKYGW